LRNSDTQDSAGRDHDGAGVPHHDALLSGLEIGGRSARPACAAGRQGDGTTERQSAAVDAPAGPSVGAADVAAVRPAPVGRAVTRTFDRIEAKPVDYLWPGWLPLRMLSLLEGDPGLGKTLILLDLVARVTRGWPMPPGPRGVPPVRPPGQVLLMAAEDSAEHALRPRLDAAGADLSRVHLLDAVDIGGERRHPTLPWNVDLIEEVIRSNAVGLWAVDPLTAFADPGLSVNRDQDVRRVTTRLKGLAERTGCAVLLLRHLNKATGGRALYRGAGSIGIVAAARATLVVGRHPTEPGRNVLAMSKFNLGPYPLSLAYAAEGAGLSARVSWIGHSELKAEEILGPGPDRRGGATEAAAWLQVVLMAEGPLLATDVVARGQAAGFSVRTLYRAKAAVGAVSVKDEFAGRWSWALPPANVPDHPDPG
jgi:putative DNA primase/helicase